MERVILVILSCLAVSTLAWSVPFYPVHGMQRGPHRFIRRVRHIRPPPVKIPFREFSPEVTEEQHFERERAKRNHDYDSDHDHGYDHDRDHEKSTKGVTGPVHTFVKTDKNANYKWGVRHHVGNKYAS